MRKSTGGRPNWRKRSASHILEATSGISANNTVYRSEELCAIFGLNLLSSHPPLKPISTVYTSEDRSATKATIERAFREREPFAFEERIVRPDGTVRSCFIARVNGFLMRPASYCDS